MPDLYRAIPSRRFRDVWEKRRPTPRIPSNVPYLVDNVWERLRPEHMPSRRHAVYASPSPEIALRCASTSLEVGDRHAVYRVEFANEKVAVAQLQIEDARKHPDIAVLLETLERAMSGLGYGPAPESRGPFAALFEPALGADAVAALCEEVPEVAELFTRLGKVSTFWSSASNAIAADSFGEVFFELGEGNAYRLVPIA